MDKPSYSTTKWALKANTFMAWLVILILAAGAAWKGNSVEFGTIAIPSMVGLILGGLGIHRGFGSWDMQHQLKAQGGGKPDPPAEVTHVDTP